MVDIVSTVKGLVPYTVTGTATCGGITLPVVNVCVPKTTLILGGLAIGAIVAYTAIGK